jgi:hypothetical protein
LSGHDGGVSDQGESEQSRYAGVSKRSRDILDSQGESGRFEFKLTSTAVKPDVLVAAANWVALNSERDSVTLLVGVAERRDPATGVTTGVVEGLRGDMSQHVDRVNQYIRNTLPIPVNVRIVEEGASTAKPFLRLEIRPTRPPHFDDQGRRVTRQGASTRPITDDELLALYLVREAHQFEQRFRRTAEELTAQLQLISSDVVDLTDQLEGTIDENLRAIQSNAWSAAQEAEESKSLAEQLLSDMSDVPTRDDLESLARLVTDRFHMSIEGAFLTVRQVREWAWRWFSMDTWKRDSRAAVSLRGRMQERMEREIDPAAWLDNVTECEFWERKLQSRDRDGATMKWWSDAIAELDDLSAEGLRRPTVEDVRGDMLDIARRVSENPSRRRRP